MNLHEEYKTLLQAPFKENEIEWRVQSCGMFGEKPWVMVLAYVQARAIQNRLDEVFGCFGWSEEYRSVGNNMICRLGVKVDNEWIYKENGASETQVEAFKGGISASFKRVAASGYGIGRYLYNLEESYAECTLEKPKSMKGYEKASTKDKKTIYWKIPKLPLWALPTAKLPYETISEEQRTALFALANGKDVAVKEVMQKLGYTSTKDISVHDYSTIVEGVKELLQAS
jgi:hypothetical protein